MSTIVKTDALLGAIKSLSKSQQAALVEQIMGMLAESSSPAKSTVSDLFAHENMERPDCPHCGAKASLGYVVKHGYKNGCQRFYCKSCGHHFFPSTKTAFARTRKDAETWREFIKMTITGRSLKECASECKIAYQTAFTWRHKVLNVFSVNQEATRMTGLIEVDEMLLPISYKGNHVQGGFGQRKLDVGAINDMPRKGYLRGTDNRSASAKNKMCVFCMVQDGNKGYYAAVPGVGFMNDAMFDATIKRHIDRNNATILTDSAKSAIKYFANNGYKHIVFVSNISKNQNAHKPEVRDGLHIQHVNAMHHHIRNFLRPYQGVSSKYLSNYIALYVWLKTVKCTKARKTIEQISVTRAASPDCYISGKELSKRPAVPICA